MALETSVVLIIFNRPETTKEVFDAIAEAKPRRLFIAADGPRFPEEAGKCEQARAVVEKVDWDCEVLKNYSDINLGCKLRPASGMDWVFSQVEEAIILEDDCLPAPSFFAFCQALLEYYRDDKRIMVISGNNFQDGQKRGTYSYYFSKYSHIWGWATWRRAWRHFDADMKTWPEFRRAGLIRSVCRDPYEQEYWTGIFDSVFAGTDSIWDAQWLYTCWSQNGLCILPNSNLVSNIGCGPDATHTLSENVIPGIPTVDIWKITHPIFVVEDHQADAYTFDNVFGGKAMRARDSFKGKVRRCLSRVRNGLARRLGLFESPISF